MENQNHRQLDKAFKIGLILKAADGFIETIAGIALLIIRPEDIVRYVSVITHHELSSDPHDFIANHILHATAHLTISATIFAAIYLLAHGISKIILVIEIIRNHLWAYVGLIVLTIGFILYQTFEWFYSHSISLILLTLFDCIIVYLTLREYKLKRQTESTH